jgi:ABC-type sulfate/molybdate transport systems ATPase subunit
MKMVMRISDRVVCLNQGRIIANGPPADIQRHPEALGFARPRRRVALPLTGTEAGSSSKIRRSRRPISAPESTVLERLRLQDAHVVEGCRDGGEPTHRSARRSHVVGEAKDHRGLRP